MSNVPVAVVTGSNKGIGLAIVRALCRQFPGDVYLTSRDPGRGQAAVAQLQQEGLRPLFHQLDIDDLQSIRALRDFLRDKYGGINVLVNNASIAFKGDFPPAELPQRREELELLQSPEEAPGWAEDGAALLAGKAGTAGIAHLHRRSFGVA